MNLSEYPHKMRVRVRFNEVDMLGVCNNAVYITYFETARLEYIKEAGLMPENGIFTDGKVYFMVRNEINYKSHSRYDDELIIYTKISYVKNSSYGYEHLIVKADSGDVVVTGGGVVAHVDPKTGKSSLIDEDFIEKVRKYQGYLDLRRELL